MKIAELKKISEQMKVAAHSVQSPDLAKLLFKAHFDVELLIFDIQMYQGWKDQVERTSGNG